MAEEVHGGTTSEFEVGETGESEAITSPPQDQGESLIVRTGGRSGDSFTLDGERFTIGRGPEADVFLDDVTVSRSHAVVVRRADGLHIDDLGSLNGTYVNRRRIESHRLEDGDELQVGKYKLTFFAR